MKNVWFPVMTALALMASTGVAEETAVAPSAVTAELLKSKVGKMVASVPLQLVKDGSFETAELETAPRYYLLYFSASW